MSLRVVVRAAGPDDAGAVETVLRASYPKLMAPGYPADVLARALPQMMQANPALLRSGTYYLAEANGTVAGCGGWTFQCPVAADMPTDPMLGHIRHFATHPEWIRRGVGRALFDRCLADARSAGVRKFECYSSVVAEPFYAALGFSPIGPVPIDMEPGIAFHSIRMICHFAD